ncbi:DUF5327 family protein [Mammaliicoccus stepanovicii]|uniref:YwdI family protein n=1 Tax=Mammaliicoccus stepanovicii TaxID=643214 RepID=A0A240A7L2_9STAP|nr:DUF5327 family protein [Mammaliicoccus stepanovicii]PNZ77164.1 hypothetical protein CD111_05090 [Mammaliicoccus stepanovicii]GGI39675.1 hypothetical protein GCM10010896_04570 [Mammaliicoccus stepanovicii]SNV79412.1 Uncharacterised protein [Mammaliicoccus stepanovicii]
MISKEQLIAAIEQELVGADNATSNEVLNRHLHAIHTLSGLIVKEEGNTHDINVKQNISSTSTTSIKQSKPQVSDEEIRKMGGKITQQPDIKVHDNLLATDDGVGNGDSLFDF